ncbi:unnamed protein product [Darwinula stevensoni]|uniref:Ubiquitin-like domain-containing protein n=1 Tax=Darwinula stevensoni TaxID=69355 RepID=A0A7R9A476_9CRUS|nr:unnamed protein product [Darwinula stevensoni]CAG0882794.1 unnamed protein product [Darwinula stevensoni]
MYAVNLRLILVSGKTKEYLFNPTESAGEIAQYVFDHWPEEWSEESVSKAEILRLIYQGRFLHGDVTLGALGLPTGKTTVMHLVPRENLPEPNSQGEQNEYMEKGKGKARIINGRRAKVEEANAAPRLALSCNSIWGSSRLLKMENGS